MTFQAISTNSFSFEALKAKQREIRDLFPEGVGLRVHRSLSWLGRSVDETGDADVRFILLWISFNAAYAADIADADVGERAAFVAFFDRVVRLDKGRRLYNAVWQRFSQEIRLLLSNQYVFGPFWHHVNGIDGFENWEERLTLSNRSIARHIARQDTARILSAVFDRLYVLRNQLIHGGATWESSLNRAQVRDGAAVLAWMVPIFIDLIMDNPDEDWGRPFYPVVPAEGVGNAKAPG